MRTPGHVAPFEYEVTPLFGAWPGHPAGKAAIAIMTRIDNVAAACAASDAGRPALDPLQEELAAVLRPDYLADEQFRRFLGNFTLRLMEHTGYVIVRAAVPLPEDRRIVLRSAATYRRAVAESEAA